MSYLDAYHAWLNSPALSAAEKAELASIQGDDKEIESRFFDQLSFGTAGLRGTMGVGLYRMNVHVIRHATQAFAQVILDEGSEAAERGVAVCFDCRNHSREFARETACVMAGNGIKVRLFESLRPTPELSFAVREYGCIAGVNVTASHNPKEYNGYKVYWADGAQLPPRHAAAIAKKMEELDLFTSIRRMDYDEAVAKGMISLMGEETDEKFLANVMGQMNDKAAVEKVADTFKMVYTPFHGTGYKLIPETLRRLGMKHVLRQMVKQKSGVIVNVASRDGLFSEPTHGSYSASKHAMIGLTKNAATEYGHMGIRTCAVCPGAIDTKMIGYLLKDLDYNVLGPMRRPADPQEIADIVCYLASDKATFLNGAIVRADGGQGL